MPYDMLGGGRAVQRRRPAMASNQYAGEGAPAPQAMPNLDPAKMGIREVGDNQWQADSGDANSILRFMSQYNAPRQAPPAQYDEGNPIEDDLEFRQAREDARSRASGKRSSAQISVDSLDADQMRGQMQQRAARELAARGFAPSSAIGLEYAKDTDRQVAEMMERRRAASEESGRRDLLTLLAQGEARRSGRAGDAYRMDALDQQEGQYMRTLAEQQRSRDASLMEEQRQFTETQREKKKDRPLRYIETIARLFGG